MSGGGGDVVMAGQAKQVDRAVTQAGHDAWQGAGEDVGAVLVVGHVAHPVEPVLDPPVALDPGGQDFGWGVVIRRGGDQVDDLDSCCLRG